MTEHRNDYGFPLVTYVNCLFTGDPAIIFVPTPTKLERAQAYAADVRQRRGMVVRKGFYVDLKP